MKAGLLVTLLPVLISASPFIINKIHNRAAPILSPVQAQEIPDSYIVVFKKHVSHATACLHHDWVNDQHQQVETAKTKRGLAKRDFFPVAALSGLKHTFNVAGGLLGYSGHFDEEVIEKVRQHPDVSSPILWSCCLDCFMLTMKKVDYIEKDSKVHTMVSDSPETEKNAPWGLARISHRHSLSFGTFNQYLYSEDGGEGVDVYVIDTGTNIDHVDFEGRAHWGKTIPQNDVDEDGNGHGTHCSGTIAGKKYGVAKKANIYAVKVLGSNGVGSMSDVVKGVEWAAVSHSEKVKAAREGKGKKGFKGSTANMSLGGGSSKTLNLAVDAAVDAGVHFAVAAGNDNADACNYSPAASKNSLTVGASNLADERAYFSNFGKCTDIFAPGLNILSTWRGSKYATNTISGTSMASPHIAGLLAYFLSLQPSDDSDFVVTKISPKQLKEDILSVATPDTLVNMPKGTPNVSLS